MNAFAEITHDHTALAHRAHELRTGVGALFADEPGALAALGRVLGVFDDEMRAHLADEEARLFPMAREKLGEDDVIDALLAQHRGLERAVVEARTAIETANPEPAVVVERVNAVIAAFEAHSEREADFLTRNKETLSPRSFMGG